MDLKGDVTATVHNLADLLNGKTDFNGFAAGEIALFKTEAAKLPAVAQAVVKGSIASLETHASPLVAAGKSELGALLSESTDDQATLVLNLLGAAGVPVAKAGPLNAAEHTTLALVIDGMKAGLDRIGIHVALGGAPVPAQPAQSQQEG